MRRFFLVVLVCNLTMQGVTRAANLLTNGDFSSNDLTGWLTWSDGAVATFEASSGAATITKHGPDHNNNDWSTGVIYQIVNVAPGTKVQLTGSWAGDQSAHGPGDWWWAETAVYSLPPSYPLNGNPQADGFIPEGTYAGGQDTYLHATFGYPGNFAIFSANGGTYSGATDFLNAVGGPAAVWSMQNIASSYYDWVIAKPIMEGIGIWDTLHRQAYNVPNGIVTSLGQVVVAIKYGSQFDDAGSLTVDNFALTVVPEPSTITSSLITLWLFGCVSLRKRSS